jgi:hypothetical protein
MLLALIIAVAFAGCSSPTVIERTVRDTVVTVQPEYIDRYIPVVQHDTAVIVAAAGRDTVTVYKSRNIVRAKIYRDTIYVPVKSIQTVERVVQHTPSTDQRWWWLILVLVLLALFGLYKILRRG